MIGEFLVSEKCLKLSEMRRAKLDRLGLEDSSECAFLWRGLLKGNGLLKGCLPLEKALLRVTCSGGGT